MAVVTTGHAWGDPRIFERSVATCLEWGLEVHVFAPMAGLPPLEGWSRHPGLRIHPLPVPGGRLGRVALAFGVWRELLRQGPFGLVHFHDPELVPPMLLLGLLCPELYTLYDIHEDLPLQVASKHYLPAWLRSPVARLADWMLGVAGGVFQGFAPATEAISAAWPQARTRIVHNYPKAIFGEATQARPLDPTRVLYVGGLAAGRGILVALEAMGAVRRRLPGVRLELVGPVMEPEVGEAVAAAVGEGWCRHQPWLAPEALTAFAAGAGVGLVTLLPQPNYLEALPTKLFEYMAMGIPVLASDFPLWRRLVCGAGAGRVVAPSAPAVAEALLAMLGDPAALQAHARAGRAAYRERYRWEAESRNLRWHLLQAGLDLSA
jgi:glycosyltransferase involved in cell wall biosynthesis